MDTTRLIDPIRDWRTWAWLAAAAAVADVVLVYAATRIELPPVSCSPLPSERVADLDRWMRSVAGVTNLAWWFGAASILSVIAGFAIARKRIPLFFLFLPAVLIAVGAHGYAQDIVNAVCAD